MRLFYISFALLLSANLAHAVKLEISDGTGLATAPVDNIDGLHCSDAGKDLVDAPSELRMSKACKPGEEGLVKQINYIRSLVKKDDAGKTNKPYLCCVRSVLDNGDPVEWVAKKDSKGKEWRTATDCSGSKSCQDPEKNFCLQKAANEPNHYQRTGNATLMEQWKDLPICCKKIKEDKCTDVDFVPLDGDCEKKVGRCKADDHTLLCSKKKGDSETTTVCCKPHSFELCPGGIYPFGLKGKNGLVDWIANNSGDVDAWKQACENLAIKTEFANASIYISDGKCCAKAKLIEKAYYGNFANRLSDQYERIATTECKNDADCGEGKFCAAVTSTYNNEPATGKACFEKIHCPHKTQTYPVYPVLSTENLFSCTSSRTCPEDAICVWGKPADATAAKITSTIGMCCPKAAYETEMCTAELLGDPFNKNTGHIDPAIRDQEDCKGGLRKWGTIDTGAGETREDETRVCCQYQPVQFHNETCTAVIMGNRTIAGVPVEDPNTSGRFLQCDKEKKRKANETKISCGDKLGFCFSEPGKPKSPGVCCDTELCPDGTTALSDMPVCDDSCMWSNSPEKDKYCLEDKKKVKKCCPPKFLPAPDWRGGRYEPNAPENTEAMKMTVKCSSSRDCGGFGAFCNEEEKYCYRLGTREYGSGGTCTNDKAAECGHADFKGAKWWCVAFGPATADLRCVTTTLPKIERTTRQPQDTEDSASSPLLYFFPFVIFSYLE